MKKQSRLGFSLIELSVVILVIGILVIGITQGSRIISEAKLKSARSLTNSSPVNSISNLALWFETTSEKSFDSGVGNNSTVANWYDLNPQSAAKNNATQGTGNNQPIYIAKGINGLPMVDFSGNHFLSFDGSGILNQNYTVFIITQRTSGVARNIVIGGMDTVNFQNLHFMYHPETSFVAAHYGDTGGNISYTIPAYSRPIPTIHTIVFRTDFGKLYYENGGTNPDNTANTSIAQTPVSSWNGSAIGRYTGGGGLKYFYGDLAEIIIFSKALNNTERQSVESYLSQKWGIKLS
jgi:prepilin-type N-terminal cleavage/methylation domain-containing protein